MKPEFLDNLIKGIVDTEVYPSAFHTRKMMTDLAGKIYEVLAKYEVAKLAGSYCVLYDRDILNIDCDIVIYADEIDEELLRKFFPHVNIGEHTFEQTGVKVITLKFKVKDFLS